MIDISIIIVNYKVKEYIIPCIKSILQLNNEDISLEIIIVDNNSKDGSVEDIQENFPDVKLFINSENIGFSKGINQGANFASGKYFYILNPDTYLINDNLSLFLKFINQNPNVSILGPSIINNKNKIEQSFWRMPTILNTVLSITHLDYFNKNKNYNSKLFLNPIEVESISGGALFVRASIFKKLNGFDPDLFWMEDIDFCLRNHNINYKTFYIPKAKVFHHKGKSAKKNISWATFNQLSSKIKFFKKHHSVYRSNFIKIFILFLSFFKSIILIGLSIVNRSYFEKLKGYILIIKSIIKSR